MSPSVTAPLFIGSACGRGANPVTGPAPARGGGSRGGCSLIAVADSTGNIGEHEAYLTQPRVWRRAEEGHPDETIVDARDAGHHRGHHHQPRPGTNCLAGSCPATMATSGLFEQQFPLSFPSTDPGGCLQRGVDHPLDVRTDPRASAGSNARAEPRRFPRRRRRRRR
jgi:hypothetical protein